MKRIALLRAVNVGGAKLLMSELRSLMDELGFAEARTLLQTGNVVFDAPEASDAEIEARIEAGLRRTLGLDTDVIVRTAAEWDAVIDGNPLGETARREPARLLVMPLKTAADDEGLARLRAAIKGREQVALAGGALYAFYPDGIGTSKLVISVIERSLAARTTARNWNTVLKLQALARA